MEAGWVDFLRAPGDAGHAVQVYARLEELAESVAAYLATGFAAGEPGVVIAKRDHRQTFEHCLGAAGWNCGVLSAAGLLVTLDAEETLASFYEDGVVSATSFERVVGGVIDEVSARHPDRRIRAFGEMVDVLTARGEHSAAAELEELWNRLARTRRFSLLCGYQLDVFDRSAQELLPSVCSAHTHMRPAYDVAQLNHAVSAALEEVLGSSSSRMVQEIVRDGTEPQSAPFAEQILMWISVRMPRHADRVLATARAKYHSATI